MNKVLEKDTVSWGIEEGVLYLDKRIDSVHASE